MHNVLILGCGRSGTSIFGELFESNYFFDYMFEPSVNDVLQNKPGICRRTAAKVPKSSGKDNSPGLSINLEEFHKKTKADYKYIFIVRHPLDTICSLKPGIAENWSHNPKPPNYRYLQKNKSLAECCAFHWDHINRAGLDSMLSIAGKDNVLIVKYEEFVNNPKIEAKKIYRFLKLPGVFWLLLSQRKFFNKIQNSTEGSYHAKKQIKWYRDDHEQRIDRWKKDLTNKEVNSCKKIVANTSSKFGYQL